MSLTYLCIFICVLVVVYLSICICVIVFVYLSLCICILFVFADSPRPGVLFRPRPRVLCPHGPGGKMVEM